MSFTKDKVIKAAQKLHLPTNLSQERDMAMYQPIGDTVGQGSLISELKTYKGSSWQALTWTTVNVCTGLYVL